MKNDSIIKNFSGILQTKLAVTASHQGRGFLSYRFPMQSNDFDRLVHYYLNSYKTAFYFHKPGVNLRFLAVGRVWSVRSDQDTRFEDLNGALSDVNPLQVHHYNGASGYPVPLFVGSMSFFPEHRDPMWRDFYPSDWFIPEFIVADTPEGCIVSYQIDLDKHTEHHRSVSRLEEFISGLATRLPDHRYEQGELKHGDTSADKNEWMNKVALIVDAIRRGEVNKVVLSRKITIHGIDDERIIEEIIKAGESFVDCYIFAFKSGGSIFIGISPEKLASFTGGSVYCNAIAGSIGRGGSSEEDCRLGDELLISEKNREEHQIVVNHIKSVLNRYCSSVELDSLPIVKKLSYIQHLYTGAYGVLHPGVSMLRVLEDLHPTPAVGGYPVTAALKMIRSMEQYDRGLYTGFLGWFDAEGNGDFCVALRSALLVDKTLFAFAGGGIVVDSKPEEEYHETEIKLHAITSLLHP